MDCIRQKKFRATDLPCNIQVNPSIALPTNPKLTNDSANAWFTIVDAKYLVKATYMDHGADAIETDAVTCALVNALRNKHNKFRDMCKYFMRYEGAFVRFIRRENADMYLTPTRNERATKCVVTRYVPGGSLAAYLQKSSKHTIRQVINGLSKTMHAMLQLGYWTGFVHNDPHMGNLLYDHSVHAFVLIDYGKCVFDPNRIEKIISPTEIAAILRKECCALGDRNPPTKLTEFYRRYKAYEQKFPVTAMGRRLTRRFAIMNDIASFSFMAWFWIIDRRMYQSPLTSPSYTTHGVIAFSADGAAFKIPTHPSIIVARAVQLSKSNSMFAPIAPGLAWMAMFILSYFEAKNGGHDYSDESMELQLSDIMGEEVTMHPLYTSGQTTTHGFKVAEATFNKNLQASTFVDTLLLQGGVQRKSSHR